MTKLLPSLFAFFLFSSALSAETGYIQIKAPPGIMIFLDGNLKGKTTSEQGGLILQDVPTGTREIKALKAGSNPKTYRINVKAGDIAVWDAGVFAPKIMVEESGETEKGGYQPIGALQIKSVPVDMKISIPSFGLNYSKTKPDVKLKKIPAGEHLVTFSGFGKNLSSKITIYDNVTTEVFVNLLKGEVQNKTEEERKQKEEERRLAMIRAEEERKEKEEEKRLAMIQAEEEKRLAMIRAEEKERLLAEMLENKILAEKVFKGKAEAIDYEKMPENYSGLVKGKIINKETGELFVIWICNYEGGKRHGLYNSFFENGQKSSEALLIKGKTEGWSRSWYKNGSKMRETYYENGLRQGKHTFWDENGKLGATHNYKDGKLDGIMTSYMEGKVLGRRTYREGKRVD